MANRSCTTCVYAYWDRCQWMTSLSSGFPSRPICANHPDSLGRLRPVPFGQVCRNYRPRPADPDKAARRIPLSDGLYAYVDAADYQWLGQWAWHMEGGYAVRYEKGRRIYMHRKIAQPREGQVVDHFNRNKMDNTRLNLRPCTPGENARNRAKRIASISQYRGVGYRKRNKKWFAEIVIAGEYIWLGFCESEIDAARTYDRAAVERFGEFANLNFPEEWPPERRQEVHANCQAALKKERNKTRRKGSKRNTGNEKKKAKGREAGHKTTPGGKLKPKPRRKRHSRVTPRRFEQ